MPWAESHRHATRLAASTGVHRQGDWPIAQACPASGRRHARHAPVRVRRHARSPARRRTELAGPHLDPSNRFPGQRGSPSPGQQTTADHDAVGSHVVLRHVDKPLDDENNVTGRSDCDSMSIADRSERRRKRFAEVSQACKVGPPRQVVAGKGLENGQDGNGAAWACSPACRRTEVDNRLPAVALWAPTIGDLSLRQAHRRCHCPSFRAATCRRHAASPGLWEGSVSPRKHGLASTSSAACAAK